MSTTIEQILATPTKEQETQSWIIVAMSKDVNRGFLDLKKAVSRWGTKPQKKKGVFVVGSQLTKEAQEREKQRASKRIN